MNLMNLMCSLQAREDAGCNESLMVASYEPNEVNYFTELPPFNAIAAASAGIISLDATVREIMGPLLEASSEVRSALMSATATHLAIWCEDEEFAAVRWRVINDYVRLDPVGPLIDGNLVLQGTTHSPNLGPALATVEFAADHEEEFSQVGRVMPWEMLLTAPEDESSGAQFLIPITLSADVEGTVRIIVFVGSAEGIPYDEDNKEGFDSSSPSFIPAIIYINRVGGSNRPEEVDEVQAAVSASRDAAEQSPPPAVALCVARGAAERAARAQEGFELGSAVNIGSDGISLIDATDFPFCIGVVHAESSQGIEDVVFLRSDARDAMPAAPEGYELVADLSQPEDEGCTFLASKTGPAPRFFKILMFICQEEGVDVADHFVESVAETLGGGVVRMAPSAVSQAFGARVGLILVDGSGGGARHEPMPVGADAIELEEAHSVHHQHTPHHETGPEADDMEEEPRSPGDDDDSGKGLHHESMSFGEISDDEFEEQDANDDSNAIERLEQEKRDLELDLIGARQANADIQKKAAVVLAKSSGKEGAGGARAGGEADGADGATAPANSSEGAAEKERHYKETMDLIAECNKRLKREQEEYEQQALDLQTRLDDKEYKAEEIADSLRQFKRSVWIATGWGRSMFFIHFLLLISV